MSINNVVIGDLGKYKGDDGLKFDGVGDSATFPLNTVGATSVTVRMELEHLTYTPANRRLYGDLTSNFWGGLTIDGRFYFKYNQLDTGADGLDCSYINGESVSFELVATNTRSDITVNGITRTYGGVSSLDILADIDILNLNGYTGDYTKGCLNYFSIAVDGVVVNSYIQNGDFGSPTLIDHSGNGNNGTINGATWWKQGIDEVYANPTLFKASRPIPMEESQKVIYTDGTPFYPVDDVFWNPYNQDATFSFSVGYQKKGSEQQKWIRRGLRRIR